MAVWLGESHPQAYTAKSGCLSNGSLLQCVHGSKTFGSKTFGSKTFGSKTFGSKTFSVVKTFGSNLILSYAMQQMKTFVVKSFYHQLSFINCCVICLR